LYVGITRARTHLWLSYAARRTGPTGREGPRRPSRFLDDPAPPGAARLRPRSAAAGGARWAAAAVAPGDARLADRLRAWRRERAKADEVPPYVVFNDRTLAALATQRPRSRGELLTIERIA